MTAMHRIVWVVDDDRSVRFVLATALREAGYARDRVRFRRAALERADRDAPAGCCSPTCACPATDGLVLLDKLKRRSIRSCR
jgi:two-component system nitrogen regulation response regulator GlnG